VLVLLLVTALCAVAGGAWLIGTESGARFAVGMAEERLPGALRIERVEGTLAGRLRLKGVDWDLGPDLRIAAERLRVNWKPTALLSGTWKLGSAHVDALRVDAAPGEEAEGEAPPVGWEERVAQVGRWPIDVRSLVVSPIEVRWAGEPYRVERVELSAVSEMGRIAIRRLVAEHARGRIEVTGAIGPGARAPIDLDVSWRIQPPEVPELAGAGTLRGGFQRLALDQTLDAPAALQVHGAIDAPLDAPSADLRAELPAVELSRLWPRLPPWRTSARLELTANVEGHVALSGEADVLDSPWGPATVRLAGHRLSEEAWRVEQLIVHRGDDGPRARASGTALLPTGGLPLFRGEIHWRRFGWPLAAGEGEPVVPPSSGHARVRASTGGLMARIRQASWIDGEWSGDAALTWEPRLAGRFRLDASGVAPGGLRPELSGELGGTFAGRGTLDEEGWRAAIDVERVRGRFEGKPLEGSGRLASDGTSLVAEQVEIDWGGASLRATGRVAEQWDLEASLSVPELSSWVTTASGRVELNGRLAGERSRPRLELSGQARSVAYAGYEVSGVGLQAAADAAAGTGDATLRAEGVSGASISGSDATLVLQLQGNLDDHRLTLDAEDAAREVTLALAGGFAPEPQGWLERLRGRWIGGLEALQVTDADLGNWSLKQEAALTLSRQELELARACLTSNASSVCLEGGWRAANQSWSARLAIRDVHANELASLWPAGISARATARLTASAAGAGGEVERISVDGEISPGTLSWELGTGLTRIEHDGANVSMRLDRSGGRGRVQVRLGEFGGLRGELQLAAPPEGAGALHDIYQRRLDAMAGFEVETIRPLGPLLEPVQNLDGRVSGELGLEGSPSELRPSGGFTLDRGQVGVAPLGVTLEGVAFRARSKDGVGVDLEGSARAGEGTVEFDGEARLFGENAPWLNIRLRGERMTLVDRPEARVIANPDLTVEIDPELISVEGEVKIPQATFDLDKLPQQTAVRSEDVVVVKGERVAAPADAGDARRLQARIEVVLGDDVDVTGKGLTADLTGSLEVEQDQGRELPTGEGEIRLVNGTYKAYGRKLELRRGELRFLGGPIDDPSLDVIAAREARDGTVAGVRITGRASEPDVQLWSNPEMPDEEALSYLLFGKPMEGGVAKSDQGLWDRAAGSLGVGLGSALVKRIGKPLGFDQARIDPGDSLQGAALVLGKYLSPRLYVAYGVGLFEPVNSFRLRYILSDHWTLEAESGEGASADLLYVIERPKD
jgi:translocation and assembly module TamB